MMDYWPMNLLFTQKDLFWLDQLMPGKKKTDEPIRNGRLERGLNYIGTLCGCRQRGSKNDSYVVNGKYDASKDNGGNYDKKAAGSGDRATFCQSVLSTSNIEDRAAATLEPLLDNGVDAK